MFQHYLIDQDIHYQRHFQEQLLTSLPKFDRRPTRLSVLRSVNHYNQPSRRSSGATMSGRASLFTYLRGEPFPIEAKEAQDMEIP